MSCSHRCAALKLSATAALCAGSLFVASPFVSLWSVSHAIETKDMSTLNRQINWRSLAHCIKDQAIGPVQTVSDDLPDFGSSFARNAISNAVDMEVTPDNLPTIVDEAMPDVGLSTGQVTPGLGVGGVRMMRHAHAHFVSANRFEASLTLPGHERETPLRITMKIEGWRWKVTQVRFPTSDPSQNRPVMEASAAASHA